jgi:hypothetical protein
MSLESDFVCEWDPVWRQGMNTGVICEQGPHVVTVCIRRKWGCKKRSRDVELAVAVSVKLRMK